MEDDAEVEVEPILLEFIMDEVGLDSLIRIIDFCHRFRVDRQFYQHPGQAIEFLSTFLFET